MQHVEEPARILERLNKGIADSFNKEVERIMLKDGMDLSLCSIDLRKGVLEFAGAFNSAYLVRQETITELKADRCSVGLAEDHMGQNFTNHLIPLEENDIIYLFTDGYADQFGGPKEKKFMYRRFRHLLLTIHKLTMEQQRIILEETIEDWRGGHDQIDDILIIGFKPSISR
jgi:serine phosphatase RsbU (regulator of sigma subunit)